MDVGLLILGLIILFGASILFKAVGFSEKGPPATGEDYAIAEPPQRPPRVHGKPQKVRHRVKTTIVRSQENAWICRSCLTENPADAEFCKSCGTPIFSKETSKIVETQKRWFNRCGWSRNPFILEIMPSLFTGYHKQVETIMEKLNLQSGHILITGNVGVGKTTLLRWLQLNLPDRFHPLYIFRPPDHFDNLIDLMASSINLNSGSGEYSMYNIGEAIEDLDKTFVLLLDEAHEFDGKIKKPLKTLGDIEDIILVMAGLPEVYDRLKDESKPLYDRLVAKVVLDCLDAEDARELIVKRIENAGGYGHEPFTKDTIPLIYEMSKGNPRAIIKLCDMAVTEAIRQGVHTIDLNIIKGLKLDVGG